MPSKPRFSDSTVASVRRLVPIDDVMFQKICESKATCQEIISTILGQEVRVLQVVPQDSIGNLQGRSVRLDCLCRLKGGVYVNVEVQKSNDDDHEARVRYNASVVTANKTPKGVKFKDVAQVIVIFISKFDIFNDGFPIYHVDRVVRETGKTRTDGFTEIYVNAAVKKYDDELNSNVSDLMNLFIDREKMNLEKFPEFSKRKNTFVNTKKGEIEMCEVVEQFARERVLDTLFECVQDGVIKNIASAAQKANLPLKEFKEQMSLRGFTVPQRKERSAANAKNANENC